MRQHFCEFMKNNIEDFTHLSNVVRQNLKKQRLQKNISQQQIADALGYKNKSDYNIRETGEKELKLGEIEAICFNFGIPISAIFVQSQLEELTKQINATKPIPGTRYKNVKQAKEFLSSKKPGEATFAGTLIAIFLLIIFLFILWIVSPHFFL